MSANESRFAKARRLVACPKCLVERGQRCVTKTGPASSCHNERLGMLRTLEMSECQ